jgi:hypothetical protein
MTQPISRIVVQPVPESRTPQEAPVAARSFVTALLSDLNQVGVNTAPAALGWAGAMVYNKIHSGDSGDKGDKGDKGGPPDSGQAGGGDSAAPEG